MLLLCVVRPTLEYGSEIWHCNKSQANASESIILGGAKKILLEHVMTLLGETWV